MKKLTILIRSLSIILFVVALVVFFQAPALVATHIDDLGHADAFGNRSYLFILPIIFIFLNELILMVLKHQRYKTRLEKLPMLQPKELYWFAALVVVLVIFAGLIVQQSMLGHS